MKSLQIRTHLGTKEKLMSEGRERAPEIMEATESCSENDKDILIERFLFQFLDLFKQTEINDFILLRTPESFFSSTKSQRDHKPDINQIQELQGPSWRRKRESSALCA
jgi:hypothetical protein